MRSRSGSLRSRSSIGSIPSRNARSSIADSSAKAPVVAPGPRMDIGGLISSGTTRYVDRIFGALYRNLGPVITLSSYALYREVSVCASCTMALMRPDRSAPIAMR